MKIPLFWSRATAEDIAPDGKPVSFSCWRSSDVSQVDAHASALATAKRVVDVLLKRRAPDRYPYGCSPLREEVLERICDGDGNLIAAVTRNAYGVLVLNAARVMFVDIDFYSHSFGEAIKSLLARIFRWRNMSPAAARERKAMAIIENFMSQHPAWGMRVYRTFAGFRALITHALFDPEDEKSLDVLRVLGCDRLYVRLCKAQQCFRARLSPKPWRCGHHAKRVPYPPADATAAQATGRWLAEYEACQHNFATCRFVAQMGNGAIHPEVGQIIELHDRATKCMDQLELA